MKSYQCGGCDAWRRMGEPLAEPRAAKAVEAAEEDEGEEVDETGVEGKDIELVMTQVTADARLGGQGSSGCVAGRFEI